MDLIEYHPMLRHDNATAGSTAQCRTGSPPVCRGAAVPAEPGPSGGHAGARGDAADGASVASPLAPARPRRLEGHAEAGSKTAARRPAAGACERALVGGAQRHGFPTDLWTLPRVATVIERLTGVPYHAGHVWYILRGLHWSLQRPARQARERDERAIRQWSAPRGPAVKNTPGASAPGCQRSPNNPHLWSLNFPHPS